MQHDPLPRPLRLRRPQPPRVSPCAVRDVDGMDGAWELESARDGRTRAVYELAVDPGPVGFMARPLERAIRPIVMGQQADELAREVAARG